MQRLTNEENPTGRKYDICITKPRNLSPETMLEQSPYNHREYWVQIQGYTKARATEIMEGVLAGTDADLGELFSTSNGTPAIARRLGSPPEEVV